VLQHAAKAKLLDMGLFLDCSNGQAPTGILSAEDLGLVHSSSYDLDDSNEVEKTESAGLAGSGAQDQISAMDPNLLGKELESRGPSGSRLPLGRHRFHNYLTLVQQQQRQDNRMRIYQVLAPTMGSRGPFFGSTLALKEDWVKLDAGYFDAPGGIMGIAGLSARL